MDDLPGIWTNTDGWTVPLGVWIEGDQLRWAWAWKPERVRPGPGLLRAFLRLGGRRPRAPRSAVEKMARTHGPLTVCSSPSHGALHPIPRPLAYAPGAWPVTGHVRWEDRPFPGESVLDWVTLARSLGAVLRIASDLAAGTTGAPRDWETILPVGFGLSGKREYLDRLAKWEAAHPNAEEEMRAAYMAGELPDEPPALPSERPTGLPPLGDLENQRRRIASYLADLANHGHVTVALAWTRDGWRTHPVAGCLQGFLTIEALALVMGGSRLCSRCLTRPASRRQATSDHPICAACHKAAHKAARYRAVKQSKPSRKESTNG